MRIIKKGSIVTRKSYGNDILFKVERILKYRNYKEVAILKGVTIRIKADSDIEDLDIVSNLVVKKHLNKLDKKIDDRIIEETLNLKNRLINIEHIYTGRILHIDGDKKYAEKSSKYYKKVGLNAIVKNIAEIDQANTVGKLLEKYNPDILVITGHDGMLKKGCNYNDVYNYRNSGCFIKAVMEARRKALNKELVIFAGACQSYYEGLIMAGANFASSPDRILIDVMDPLIVAEKIAKTSKDKFVTIKDIEGELRDGRRGISGVGGSGKMKRMSYNELVK